MLQYKIYSVAKEEVMDKKVINVGIGFATGRKNFQRVLRSYIYNWKESGLVDNTSVSLNLFVAYDLNYMGTIRSDFTAIPADVDELIDSKHFIGSDEVERTKHLFIESGAASPDEVALIFQKGYASLRNVLLVEAIKSKMDYLLFLDDDEYPMAVTKNAKVALWSGQHVLKTHLLNIENADITYGYHCGYISPIPTVEYSDILTESDFGKFILAISNDIVNWDTMKAAQANGGVTYADASILAANRVLEVPEVNHAKFISGSNLCVNLTEPTRTFPFYNPPGARGEDTFLSTCLSDRRVLRVPCYAFHDGFSTYNHLLSGVLPTVLKPIKADSKQIVKRFYNACIGWTRYKPLLLYITNPSEYEEKMLEMETYLSETLPHICKYFGFSSFKNISAELRKYNNAVEEHYGEFLMTKKTWAKLIGSLENML